MLTKTTVPYRIWFYCRLFQNIHSLLLFLFSIDVCGQNATAWFLI